MQAAAAASLRRYLQSVGGNRQNVVSFESPVVDVFGHVAPQLSVVRLGIHAVLTHLGLLSLHMEATSEVTISQLDRNVTGSIPWQLNCETRSTEKCWAHSPLRAASCPFTRCH